MDVRLRLACVLLVVVFASSACVAPVAPKPSSDSQTPGSAPLPPGATGTPGALVPGITDLGDGRVVASGWVTEVDLEGGMWQIVSQPPTSSAGGGVVAVILPGKVTAEEFAAVRGTFIGAEGVLEEGASIRMSGPEVVVDAIRVY